MEVYLITVALWKQRGAQASLIFPDLCCVVTPQGAHFTAVMFHYPQVLL